MGSVCVGVGVGVVDGKMEVCRCRREAAAAVGGEEEEEEEEKKEEEEEKKKKEEKSSSSSGGEYGVASSSTRRMGGDCVWMWIGNRVNCVQFRAVAGLLGGAAWAVSW